MKMITISLLLAFSLALTGNVLAQDCAELEDWCIPTPEGFTLDTEASIDGQIDLKTVGFEGAMDNTLPGTAQMSIFVESPDSGTPSLDTPASIRLGYMWGLFAGAGVFSRAFDDSLVIDFGEWEETEDGYTASITIGQAVRHIVALENKPMVILSYAPGEFEQWQPALEEVLAALQ